MELTDRTRNPNRDAGCVVTENVRADEVRLGDVLLLPNWKGGVELTFVRSLELVGDDVEFNGGKTTTSQGNLVTRFA